MIPEISEKIFSLFNMSIVDMVTTIQFLVIVVIAGAIFYKTKNIVLGLVVGLVSVIGYELVPILTKESFDIIFPGTDVPPSCVNITKEDLEKEYEGGEKELKKEMVNAHVPHNVFLDDASAPLISSYLLNSGSVPSFGVCKLVE